MMEGKIVSRSLGESEREKDREVGESEGKESEEQELFEEVTPLFS